MGAMGSAGASDAVGADAVTREQLRQAELESSYRSASGLGFDELIDPRDLRNAVLAGLELSARRRMEAPQPKARDRDHPLTPGSCAGSGIT